MILGTNNLNSEVTHNRLSEVIDDFNIMVLFSDASEELGSDLVIFCDIEADKAGAMPRSEFIEEYLSKSENMMWDEMSTPAIKHLPDDGLNQLAFWLIVAFSDEEVYCTAVGAYLMQPGGDA